MTTKPAIPRKTPLAQAGALVVAGASFLCSPALAQVGNDPNLEAAKRVFGADVVGPAAPMPSLAPSDKALLGAYPRTSRETGSQPAPPPSNDLGARIEDVVRDPPELDAAARALLAEKTLKRIVEKSHADLQGYDPAAAIKRMQAGIADIDGLIKASPVPRP